MQVQQGGRHCDHCDKTVVDFTRMTDAQLVVYFAESIGHHCGRFDSEQFSRNVGKISIRKSKFWSRVVGGALLALTLANISEAQIKIDSSHLSSDQNQHTVVLGVREISGTLVDEKGNPVFGAFVEVKIENLVVAKTLTDFDGEYYVAPSSRSQFATVTFKYLSYVLIITYVPTKKVIVNATLAMRDKPNYRIADLFSYLSMTLDPPGRKTVQAEQIEHSR